jgi:hypothetical protein
MSSGEADILPFIRKMALTAQCSMENRRLISSSNTTFKKITVRWILVIVRTHTLGFSGSGSDGVFLH